VDRITDAFVWPVRDPDWPAKLLLTGLILLVPIVGSINGLGWMLAALDRLRAGDEKLPPANFNYLGRGIRLFVVNLVYVLALAIVVALFFALAVLVLGAEGRGAPNPGLVALGLFLNLLAFSGAALGSLALLFAMPAIILATDRGGIVGGLHVGDVTHRLRESPVNTLIAGLMLVAAGFIGQLGLIACGIGVVFTTAYALAMQAWIVRSFEVKEV
jgi:hypothetical protein